DQRRFTFGGWFSKLLEKQSLPNQPFHEGERCAAPAVGGDRYGHGPLRQCNPYPMGKSVCHRLCCAVLGRRRLRDELGHGPEWRMETIYIGCGAEWQRRRRPSEAFGCTRHDAFRSRFDVEILWNLRYARGTGYSKLRRLRPSDALRRYDRRLGKLHRCLSG